jgi:hypothetical protein
LLSDLQITGVCIPWSGVPHQIQIPNHPDSMNTNLRLAATRVAVRIVRKEILEREFDPEPASFVLALPVPSGMDCLN